MLSERDVIKKVDSIIAIITACYAKHPKMLQIMLPYTLVCEYFMLKEKLDDKCRAHLYQTALKYMQEIKKADRHDALYEIAFDDMRRIAEKDLKLAAKKKPSEKKAEPPITDAKKENYRKALHKAEQLLEQNSQNEADVLDAMFNLNKHPDVVDSLSYDKTDYHSIIRIDLAFLHLKIIFNSADSRIKEALARLKTKEKPPLQPIDILNLINTTLRHSICEPDFSTDSTQYVKIAHLYARRTEFILQHDDNVSNLQKLNESLKDVIKAIRERAEQNSADPDQQNAARTLIKMIYLQEHVQHKINIAANPPKEITSQSTPSPDREIRVANIVANTTELIKLFAGMLQRPNKMAIDLEAICKKITATIKKLQEAEKYFQDHSHYFSLYMQLRFLEMEVMIKVITAENSSNPAAYTQLDHFMSGYMYLERDLNNFTDKHQFTDENLYTDLLYYASIIVLRYLQNNDEAIVTFKEFLDTPTPNKFPSIKSSLPDNKINLGNNSREILKKIKKISHESAPEEKRDVIQAEPVKPNLTAPAAISLPATTVVDNPPKEIKKEKAVVFANRTRAYSIPLNQRRPEVDLAELHKMWIETNGLDDITDEVETKSDASNNDAKKMDVTPIPFTAPTLDAAPAAYAPQLFAPANAQPALPHTPESEFASLTVRLAMLTPQIANLRQELQTYPTLFQAAPAAEPAALASRNEVIAERLSRLTNLTKQIAEIRMSVSDDKLAQEQGVAFTRSSS